MIDPKVLNAVAQAAGVSPSTLRAHFAEASDGSPARWLLDQRLAQARCHLRDGAATVTEVALRYTFGNVGRFSHAYREAFGEYSSRTLSWRD